MARNEAGMCGYFERSCKHPRYHSTLGYPDPFEFEKWAESTAAISIVDPSW